MHRDNTLRGIIEFCEAEGQASDELEELINIIKKLILNKNNDVLWDKIKDMVYKINEF